ncbi:hypothetical protein GE21DRAFT_1345656, partial [Neurospora crassa]
SSGPPSISFFPFDAPLPWPSPIQVSSPVSTPRPLVLLLSHCDLTTTTTATDPGPSRLHDCGSLLPLTVFQPRHSLIHSFSHFHSFRSFSSGRAFQSRRRALGALAIVPLIQSRLVLSTSVHAPAFRFSVSTNSRPQFHSSQSRAHPATISCTYLYLHKPTTHLLNRSEPRYRFPPLRH